MLKLSRLSLYLVFFMTGSLYGNYVKLLDFNTWRTGLSSHGVHTLNLWVDIEVPKQDGQRTVGILWTSDDWQTSTISYANWEEGIDSKREKWGVDLVIGSYSNYQPAPQDVEFSVFYDYNGQRYWEPRKNFSALRRPTSDHPVRFVRAQSSYDRDQGARLSGHARALDFGPGSQLLVHYSIDGGEQFKTIAAEWTSYERWQFSIEQLGKESLPDTVSLYLEYRDGQGQRFFDGSPDRYRQFSFQLAPQLYQQISLPEDRDFVGIAYINLAAQSHIGVAQIQINLDQTGWRNYQAPMYLDSRTLEVGDHQLATRVVLNGGYVSEPQPPQHFTVSRSLLPDREIAFLPEANYRTSLQTAKQLKNGSQLLLWQDYPEPNQPAVHFIELYNAEGSSRLWRSQPFEQDILNMTADDAGVIYLLLSDGYQSPKMLAKLDQTGQLIETFGSAGLLNLNATSELADLNCHSYPQLIWQQKTLLLFNQCQDEVMIFTDEGQWLRNLAIPGAVSIDWDHSSAALAVLFSDQIKLYHMDQPGTLSLDSHIAFPVSYPQVFNKEGKYIWVYQNQMLAQYNDQGELLRYWQSSGSSYHFGDLGYRVLSIEPNSDHSAQVIYNGFKKALVHFIDQSM